jgi:hypothetical protein
MSATIPPPPTPRSRARLGDARAMSGARSAALAVQGVAGQERRAAIERARLARAELVARDEEVRRRERARFSSALVQEPQVETDFPGAMG